VHSPRPPHRKELLLLLLLLLLLRLRLRLRLPVILLSGF